MRPLRCRPRDFNADGRTDVAGTLAELQRTPGLDQVTIRLSPKVLETGLGDLFGWDGVHRLRQAIPKFLLHLRGCVHGT